MYVDPRRSYKSDVKDNVKPKSKPVTNADALHLLPDVFEKIKNEDLTVSLHTAVRHNPAGDFLTITINGMTITRRGLVPLTVLPEGRPYARWLKDRDEEIPLARYVAELRVLLKGMEERPQRFTGDDRRELSGLIRALHAVQVTVTAPYPKRSKGKASKGRRRTWSTTTPKRKD